MKKYIYVVRDRKANKDQRVDVYRFPKENSWQVEVDGAPILSGRGRWPKPEVVPNICLRIEQGWTAEQIEKAQLEYHPGRLT